MKLKNTIPLFVLILLFSNTLKAQSDSLESQLNGKNDWPALHRFMKENRELRPAAPGENRVVFMGNSITEGWIKQVPEFFNGKPYVNRGIGGQTTPQMLLRFRQDVIDLKPKVVIILAGVNDIAGNTGPSSLKMIEDNISSMAQLATANGIKVVLCSVLPASVIPWKPETDAVNKISELNKWIRSYAAQNHHTYVDYFTAMADDKKGLPSDLSGDGVHPNKKGYAIMAPLAEKGIADALRKK